MNRGGSWNNPARNCRSANRNNNDAREPQQQPGLPCLPSSTESGTRPPNRTRSRPRRDLRRGWGKTARPGGSGRPKRLEGPAGPLLL